MTENYEWDDPDYGDPYFDVFDDQDLLYPKWDVLEDLFSEKYQDELHIMIEREEQAYEKAQVEFEAECFSIELSLAGIRQRKI